MPETAFRGAPKAPRVKNRAKGLASMGLESCRFVVADSKASTGSRGPRGPRCKTKPISVGEPKGSPEGTAKLNAKCRLLKPICARFRREFDSAVHEETGRCPIARRG